MERFGLSKKSVLVWSLSALFFLYEFFLRTVIGTFQEPLMQEFGLSGLQYSCLSATIFMAAYGLMQIPSGLILERFGLNRALTFGTFCCALASLGFSQSGSYGEASGFRFFMGMGASFGFVGVLMTVHEWMPREKIALFIGVSQWFGTMGPMCAAGPLESLCISYGVAWRTVFLMLGIFGCVLGVLIACFVENRERVQGAYRVVRRNNRNSIAALFLRKEPWFLAILSSALYFTVEYLSENEGRSFLVLRGISSVSASYMLTLSWLGYAIGCPLLGYVSDMWCRRRIWMQWSGLLGMACVLWILYGEGVGMYVAFFLLGVSASGQSIAFATVSENFDPKVVAIGFALNNGLITLSSAVLTPVLGYWLDQGSGSIVEYQTVFMTLACLYGMAFLIARFCIHETYGKSRVNLTIIDRDKSFAMLPI